MQYPIRQDTSKQFQENDFERHFFSLLYARLSEMQNQKIVLLRMSNGALSVTYNRYPIGKVKLQGRTYWIQVLKGIYDSKIYEGDPQILETHIEEWVKYLNKL